MPASKKPRKKHQHKVTEKGLESWAMFTIRGEGWSESMLNDFAQDFLFSLDAIYWSKGEDPYMKRLFGRTKDQLVMAWVLGNLLIERDEYRKVIAEANKCLQAAFNCWLDHKRILYPQLKRCKHLMLQLFNTITAVYLPHEVNTCHSQESRNPWIFDKAEAELDGMLGLKGKEIHYAAL